MYLSQLILNPHNYQVQKELAQPYEMHRTLTTRCFNHECIEAQRNTPRVAATGAHGLLFRLDVVPQSGQIVLLAQSQAQPNWVGLPTGYALLVQGPKEFDLSDKLKSGQRFQFRLRASPTKRLGNSTEFKQDIGKRVPIKIEPQQIEWLQRKASQHGFQVTRVAISQKDRQFGQKANCAMQWHSVCFDGELVVQDSTLLKQAVQCGIGTAKGMGFGLLSLSPLPRPTGEG